MSVGYAPFACASLNKHTEDLPTFAQTSCTRAREDG